MSVGPAAGGGVVSFFFDHGHHAASPALGAIAKATAITAATRTPCIRLVMTEEPATSPLQRLA
jgi:hypothetical protein